MCAGKQTCTCMGGAPLHIPARQVSRSGLVFMCRPPALHGQRHKAEASTSAEPVAASYRGVVRGT